MTVTEIRNKVLAELDSRDLAQPLRRKRALEQVLNYINHSQYCSNGKVLLPSDKNHFKQEYKIYKGKELSGAEESAINEMYKQYEP